MAKSTRKSGSGSGSGGQTGKLAAGTQVSPAGAIQGGLGSTIPIKVELQRPGVAPTSDQVLWSSIRNRTSAVAFTRYSAFVEAVLCHGDTSPSLARDAGSFGSPSVSQKRDNLENRITIMGSDSYKLLRLATEAFLIVECGFRIDGDPMFSTGSGFESFNTLLDENVEARRKSGPVLTASDLEAELSSYLDSPNGNALHRVASAIIGMNASGMDDNLPYCPGLLQARLSCPSLIELIWSYWHEQGMLVQSINAILLRFQNKRNGEGDPLVNFELDPLRGLNNLLWGFLQDESARLSVTRRAYEYDHHYGLNLVGRSVERFNPADSRVRFIEAFHTLLYRTMMFFREDDDTNVIADGFAMLNALRELQIILGEGAHNQYGDLPWQARKEMLMMQWLLARPEMREFIRGRHMVPYQEPWMGPVDDMKRLQGWTDVGVTHFHELAETGEQILLTVRHGPWVVSNDQDEAKNWARYWRPEIQRYIHAYAAVTGVDLSVEISDTRAAHARFGQPSDLMVERNRMRPLPHRPRTALPQPRRRKADMAPAKPGGASRLVRK